MQGAHSFLEGKKEGERAAKIEYSLAWEWVSVEAERRGWVKGGTAPSPCTHPLLSQDGSSKSKAQGGLSKGGAPFTQGIGRPVHQICFSAPE